MAEYAKEIGFKLSTISPEDPQCNGFAETFVKGDVRSNHYLNNFHKSGSLKHLFLQTYKSLEMHNYILLCQGGLEQHDYTN